MIALFASTTSAFPRDFDKLDFHDTTVTLDELPKPRAKWKRYAKVHYRHIVPIALVDAPKGLTLVFIEPIDENGGAPHYGVVRTFSLAPSIAAESYTPMVVDEYERDISGPIRAAVRVRASETSERRQVVVYVPLNTSVVLVATKLASERTWTPLLHVELPHASKIVMVQPQGH